jgi:predicted choloylglycine hydrolase
MDGMNEYGVAVSVLLIENNSTHQINPDLVDITTTIIIRGILDTCINVEEAIKFFNKFNYHDAIEGTNCHFMVTDAKGNSAVIEYINNEMKVIKPIGNYSFVTNFYLYFDRISEIKGGLDYRYDILKENLNDSNVKMAWNEAMELLNKVHQEITLWSNIYDTRNSTVITAFRSDYSILYEFNLFNPLKNIIKTLPGPEPEITSDMESSSEEEYNSEIESEKTTTSETESFASHLKLSLSFLISISLLF